MDLTLEYSIISSELIPKIGLILNASLTSNNTSLQLNWLDYAIIFLMEYLDIDFFIVNCYPLKPQSFSFA